MKGRPLADLWSRMPRLRLIQTLSAGVDWIVESMPSGVVLCSARGAHDVPVSEWVVAAILSDIKNLAAARDHEQTIDLPVGRWKPLIDAGSRMEEGKITLETAAFAVLSSRA